MTTPSLKDLAVSAVKPDLRSTGITRHHQETKMGFRSTFTTEHVGTQWPQWFIDKYADWIWFPTYGHGPLHSKFEAKTYDRWADLHTDIQRAIEWKDRPDGSKPESFVLLYLHECGGVTRCQIERDAIKWSEPAEWRSTEGVEHNYCYGCSDV